jgi:hypothetical protein
MIYNLSLILIQVSAVGPPKKKKINHSLLISIVQKFMCLTIYLGIEVRTLYQMGNSNWSITLRSPKMSTSQVCEQGQYKRGILVPLCLMYLIPLFSLVVINLAYLCCC